MNRPNDSVECSMVPSTTTKSYSDDIIRIVVGRRTLTVGRLSLLMLVLYTFTDFALQVVQARIQTVASTSPSTSPDHHSNTSPNTKGIRPAFRFHWGTTETSAPPKSYSAPRRDITLSGATPFVPLADIADMTLADLAIVFRFAMESTREGFPPARFFDGMVPRVQHVLQAMSEAISRSRGKGVAPARTYNHKSDPSPTTGHMDALQFCAVMRLLAEWRVLRQVPEGYKGFTIGMSLGQKDVIQNVAKIEQAVHRWIDHQVEQGVEELRSPTLRELLEYEIEANVHDNSKLPRLKDKTAATGLLWARRQLHYQTALFANVVQVPTVFASTNAAVSASYAEVYGKYHGWAIQKIFNYSFQSAPPTSEIFKVMNPHRLQQVMASLEEEEKKTKTKGAGQISNRIEDNSKVRMNPMQKFGKFSARFFFFFHAARRQQRVKPIHNVNSDDDDDDDDNNNDGMSLDVDQWIAHEMEKDAFQNIDAFLQMARPLLADLALMFEELNMDDPSKV